MATPVQMTFDCSDPDALASFWAEALGYRKDWEWDEPTVRWMREGGLPEDQMGSRAAVSDPDGRGPRLFFQRVPEPKAGKNRLHLDLNVGPERIDEEVARLGRLGATVVREVDEAYGPIPSQRWVTMADPEGNEFCVE